jgi:hypothetical protein
VGQAGCCLEGLKTTGGDLAIFSEHPKAYSGSGHTPCGDYSGFALGPHKCNSPLGQWSEPDSGLFCLQGQPLHKGVPEEVCCGGLTFVTVAGGARPHPPGAVTSFCVDSAVVAPLPAHLPKVSVAGRL